MSENTLLTKKRVTAVLVVFSMCLFILLLRVAYIQLVDAEFYKQKAYSQQNRDMLISANRGTIYDTNGTALAISATIDMVTVSPLEVKKSKKNIKDIANDLGAILKIEPAKILKKLEKKSQYEIIVRKIEKEASDKIRDYCIKNKIGGIQVREDTKRFYPNGNLASHVVGFTGDDNQGLYGIEKMLDAELKGVGGKILSEVDGSGTEVPFKEEKRIQPQEGLNVHLTIDESIQYIVQKELENAIEENKVINGAAGIVIDPTTGDILAMVSKPDFDLNSPRALPAGLDKPNWTGNTAEEIKILNETVWRNKAVTDTYEPGSTFKAVTSVAGLEEGVVNPNTPTSDRTIAVSGKGINCWKPNAHGDLPFYEGVYYSCNPVFVKIGQGLGVDKFYRYVKTFGFYDKTDILLPGEGVGYFHKKPTELDMAVASFGQRFQITPIQLSMAYGAIVNGGYLMKPRLVKKLTNKQGVTIKNYEPEVVRTCISKNTSNTIKTILEGVVSEGTGKNAYAIGYRVGGKTGTSETTAKGRYIASFSGFAPADRPRIHVLIILDNPKGESYYGGQIAAPVAGEIIKQTLSHLGVQKRYTEKEKKLIPEEVAIPDVRGKTIKEASDILKEIGLQYELSQKSNTEEVIVEQMPKPGASIEKKSFIILYSYKAEEELKVKMPDLKNAPISEATRILKDLGLNIRVNGVGVAVKQSRDAGEFVSVGSVIEVKFKFLETD